MLVAWHCHDDVMKWKHFPRYWPCVRGIHRSPVNSPHKGQWRGALMFSLICVWINSWVNNRETGDLRRHCAHYDVTVMIAGCLQLSWRTRATRVSMTWSTPSGLINSSRRGWHCPPCSRQNSWDKVSGGWNATGTMWSILLRKLTRVELNRHWNSMTI